MSSSSDSDPYGLLINHSSDEEYIVNVAPRQGICTNTIKHIIAVPRNRPNVPFNHRFLLYGAEASCM
jgi:hypothetical protein